MNGILVWLVTSFESASCLSWSGHVILLLFWDRTRTVLSWERTSSPLNSYSFEHECACVVLFTFDVSPFCETKMNAYRCLFCDIICSRRHRLQYLINCYLVLVRKLAVGCGHTIHLNIMTATIFAVVHCFWHEASSCARSAPLSEQHIFTGILGSGAWPSM